MKKQLFSFLTLFIPLLASAYDVKYNGIYFDLNHSNKTAIVTYYSRDQFQTTNNNLYKYAGEVTIPSQVYYNGEKYSVTSISSEAFRGCTKLTSVIIPNSVNFIGFSAFEDCSGLTSMTIPNSVTYISNSVFSGCSSLTSVTIPNSVTYIGSSVFSSCSSLTSVTIPNSVTSIGSSLFDDCSGLITVVVETGNVIYDSRDDCNAIIETSTNTLIAGCKTTFIPQSVTGIGKGAFKNFKILTSMNIPNSVTSIGESAFEGCIGITSVTIPNSVISIGSNAFYNSNLKKTIWLTNTPPIGYTNAMGIINYVSNNLFSDIKDAIIYPSLSSLFEVDGVKYVPVSLSERICDAIDCVDEETVEETKILSTVSYKGITLNVKNVMPYLAYQNRNIKTLTLENDGIISSFAFSGSKLETIKINGKVTGIDSCAFQDCYVMTKASIGGSENIIGRSSFKNCLQLKELIIDDGVKLIDDSAFVNCKSLPTITIPKAVTKINNSVFYGCIRLKEVIIADREDELTLGYQPDETTMEKKPLFASCPLDSVYIGGNITYQTSSACGYSPFYCNTSLRVVLFNDKETEITMGEFEGCSNLKRIDIGGNVSLIGSSAFCGCKTLPTITIPKAVTKIDNSVFYGCESLKEVIIADREDELTLGYQPGETTMEKKPLFASCPLDSVYIGGNITYQTSSACGYSPFYCNTSLRTVHITDKETMITSHEFDGCTKLNRIIIGSNVVSIGSHAFYNCNSLKSIDIPDAVTSIGSHAFENCSGMLSAYIGNGLATIEDNTFYGCSFLKVVKMGALVSEIKKNAFSNCSSLQYISKPSVVTSLGITHELPFAVTSIGDYAFNNCTSLSSTGELFNVVTSIGNYAFNNCTSLKYLVIPDAVTSLGEGAFQKCSGIQEARIHNGVESLNEKIFYECSSLESVYIGDGVKSIGLEAFYDCTSLRFIAIGSQVKEIREFAFYNCKVLPTLIIPKSVTKIYDNVFHGCDSLTKVIITDREDELTLGSNQATPLFAPCPLDSIYIGGNITYQTSSDYGYSPFYRNTTLRAVHITNKETEISPNEFYGCTNLQRVIIGDGVTTIGEWAFSGCQNLKYFSFGSQMKTIGKEAFSDCTSVIEISSKAKIPPVCGAQALDDINKWECQLYIPYGTLTLYQTADQWKEFLFISEMEKVVKKGDVNDDGEVDIADIVVTINQITGDTSTNFDREAADINGDGEINTMDVTSIIGIILNPEGTPQVDPIIAFEDSNVKAICVANWDTDGDGELSESEAAAVSGIGNMEFSMTYITSFNELQYFTGLTDIGRYAFSSCAGLTSVSIPNSVTSIGESAFGGCWDLISVFIPNSVTYIGKNAFRNSPLKEVHCNWTTPISVNNDPFDSTIYSQATLFVPKGSASAYKSVEYWKDFLNIVEE